MVDYSDTEPSLQLVGARFLNFVLSKLSRDFKLRGIDITGLSKRYISVVLDARVTWSGIAGSPVCTVQCAC